MELIAKKPCSFGGKKFFIGEKIPEGLVTDPATQEKLGVIAVSNAEDGKEAESEDAVYTQEQVDSMIAEAIEEAVNNTVMEMSQRQEEIQNASAKLLETEPGAYNGTVQIPVKCESDGENEQIMAVPATPEEIQQVFSIMQLNAEEGAKTVSGIESENVLILLHAADSRKTIKDAAKKRADNLFSTKDEKNGAGDADEATDTNPEGADT